MNVLLISDNLEYIFFGRNRDLRNGLSCMEPVNLEETVRS